MYNDKTKPAEKNLHQAKPVITDNKSADAKKDNSQAVKPADIAKNANNKK